MKKQTTTTAPGVVDPATTVTVDPSLNDQAAREITNDPLTSQPPAGDPPSDSAAPENQPPQAAPAKAGSDSARVINLSNNYTAVQQEIFAALTTVPKLVSALLAVIMDDTSFTFEDEATMSASSLIGGQVLLKCDAISHEASALMIGRAVVLECSIQQSDLMPITDVYTLRDMIHTLL